MANKDFLAVLGAETVDEVTLSAVRDYVKGQVDAYEIFAGLLDDGAEQDLDKPAVYRQVAADVAEVLEVLDSLVTRYGVYDKLFGALRTVEALKEAE